MATKTLSISEEAYNNLIKLKKERESYSQLILRITTCRGRPDFILETLESFKGENLPDDFLEEVEKAYLARKNQTLGHIELFNSW
jgi:predicted CopG family antitoxin